MIMVVNLEVFAWYHPPYHGKRYWLWPFFFGAHPTCLPSHYPTYKGRHQLNETRT